MITNEQLFEEDYTPPYILEKERLVKESLEHAVTVGVEFNCRMSALEAVDRISAKHPPYLR